MPIAAIDGQHFSEISILSFRLPDDLYAHFDGSRNVTGMKWRWNPWSLMIRLPELSPRPWVCRRSFTNLLMTVSFISIGRNETIQQCRACSCHDETSPEIPSDCSMMHYRTLRITPSTVILQHYFELASWHAEWGAIRNADTRRRASLRRSVATHAMQLSSDASRIGMTATRRRLRRPHLIPASIVPNFAIWTWLVTPAISTWSRTHTNFAWPTVRVLQLPAAFTTAKVSPVKWWAISIVVGSKRRFIVSIEHRLYRSRDISIISPNNWSSLRAQISISRKLVLKSFRRLPHHYTWSLPAISNVNIRLVTSNSEVYRTIRIWGIS